MTLSLGSQNLSSTAPANISAGASQLMGQKTTPSGVADEIIGSPPSDVTAKPSRYPKRKRKEMKYFDSDAEDTDDDLATAWPAKRAKQPNRPLPKKKIFPFMQLPPELRNKIFEECLKDDKGIFLRGKESGHHRIVRRCRASDCSPRWKSGPWNYPLRFARSYSEIPEIERRNGKPRPLVPNLLAVSKQMNAEAAPMLYGQPIHVADTYALLNFVNYLTPRTAGMLRDLTVKSWSASRGQKSFNFPTMSALASCGATKLDRLNLDCRLGYFGSDSGSSSRRGHSLAYRVARKVYRDCYPWLHAVGRAKRDKCAAVEVLRIGRENLETSPGTYRLPAVMRKDQIEKTNESVVMELKKLLKTH